MKFKEMLAALVAQAADERPDTMFDDLGGAFDDDLSSYDAKIGQLETANAELNTQLAAAKVHNYELMMAAAPAETDDTETDSDSETDSDDVESVDDLFESEDDN